MTGNKDLLSNYQEKKGTKIRFGGGVKKPSVGTGEVNLGKLKLTNVLHVAGLEYNLISQGQLADKGYYMISKAQTCSLIDEQTEEVVLNGERKGAGSLYRALSSDVEICLVGQGNIAEQSWLWHKRLGHLNFKTMKSLIKHEMVKGIPSLNFKQDSLCGSCQKGKQAKNAFKTKVYQSTDSVLQLLHMDLFESSKKSIGGSKYGLVVIDDFSRFT